MPLTGERVLKHFDRILFGKSHFCTPFLFLYSLIIMGLTRLLIFRVDVSGVALAEWN